MKPALKPLLWIAALIALGLTFAAYLQPGLVMDVATRLWSCF
jgi:hypothetical protein